MNDPLWKFANCHEMAGLTHDVSEILEKLVMNSDEWTGFELSIIADVVENIDNLSGSIGRLIRAVIEGPIKEVE